MINKPFYDIDGYIPTPSIEIIMFAKAKELQENHVWEYGDLYYTGVEGCYYYCDKSKSCKQICPNDVLKYPTVWLPHQDQLQKMVFGINGDIQGYVWKLHEFVGVTRATFPDVSSMEQLWLAFVMKEKYNKIWDGKDWILNSTTKSNES